MSLSSLPLGLHVMTDPTKFTEFKAAVVETTEISRDALHMHIGTALALLLFVVLGRRWWSAGIAWLLVFLLALWGERLDHLSDPWFTEPQKQFRMSVHDILNTMFWPTVLLLAGPLIFRGVDWGRRPRRWPWSKYIARSGERGDEPFE